MRDYFKELYEDDDDDERKCIAKDGERMRVPMIFMDAARSQEIKSACDERNAMRTASSEAQLIADGSRKLEAEREAYQKRISEAWRGPSQADHERHEDGFDDSPEAQRERYIKRITNAWRAGP